MTFDVEKVFLVLVSTIILIQENLSIREKKSPNIIKFFRQRSEYISDFTLRYPEKNLVDFRGFNSSNPLSFKNN